MIKILILILSLSFRTANLENCPADYEITGGLKGKNNKATFMYERENGKYYNGREIELGYKYFNFQDFVKTAKKINSQEFSFLYPKYEYVKIGITYNLKNWENPNVLLTAILKKSFYEIQYSRSFERENLYINFRKEFNLRNRINVIPTFSLRKYDNDLFYQFKLIFNLNIYRG